MGKKLAILHVFFGALIFCNGSPLVNESFPASASVSESTVTLEISSKSVADPSGNQGENATEEDITNGKKISFSASADDEKLEKPSTQIAEDNVTKLQKAKKKILNSNAKISGEKLVLPSDKQEKENSSNSFPEATATEGNVTNHSGKDPFSESVAFSLAKKEKTTESVEGFGKYEPVAEKEEEEKWKKNGVVEGSSRENKTRFSSGSTEKTTNEFATETTLGKPEKFAGSNKEEYGRRVDSKFVQTFDTLPMRKISKNDSLRNVIRFEPTGERNLTSLPPNQLPSSVLSELMVTSSANGSEDGMKSRENETIAFPSDGGGNRSEKEIDSVTVLPGGEGKIRKTTEKSRGGSEKAKAEEEEEDDDDVEKSPPVRFDSGSETNKQTTATDSTAAAAAAVVEDLKKYQMEANSKMNSSVENSEMEIPATGASWTLATLRSSTSAKSTEKPETGENDEESVAVAGKEQNEELKNTIPDTVMAAEKRNSSNFLHKSPDAWTPIKTTPDDGFFVNETEVVIPGSVDSGRAKVRPTPEDGELPKAATTAIGIATGKVATTEGPEKPSGTPGITTEDSNLLSTIGRSSAITEKEYPLLPLATTRRVMGDESTTTTTTTTSTEPLTASLETEAFPFSTSPKSGSFEETNGEGKGDTSTLKQEQGNKQGVQNFSTGWRQPAVAETTENLNDAPTDFPSSATNRKTTETDPAGASISTPLSPDAFPTSETTSFDSPAGEMTTATASTFTGKTMPVTTANSTGKPATEIATEAIDGKAAATTATTAFASSTEITATDEFAVAEAEKTSPPPPEVPSTPSWRPETVAPESAVTFEVAPKPDVTTEESIYYQNYVPTTIDPRQEITEENVPAYLRLTVQTSSWSELCTLKESLKDSILKMLHGKNVSSEFVHFLNLNERNCREKMRETGSGDENGTVYLPVNMFLMDKNGDFDKNLSEAFLTLWGRHGLDFDLPIRKVDFVTPIVNLTELTDSPLGGSVVAAIVISCVAGICVILLGILFVIMKRRQKRFNYGQRCTPVSLDAYSLDSVSVYNSVRRKGQRASKRSYGNAAFDDPEVPSHPVNFAGLANFSSGKEQLHEEFGMIPQVYPKAEELPEGAETKNRYANVIPLPETRVHLKVRDGDPLSDYINANYVRGGKGAEKLYIACQGPMQSTVEDFWRMVWEQQCKVILMITDLQENGMEKCVDYLPPNEVTDNLRLFGDYQVTLKKRDVKEKYIISNLTLKNMETNLWREVTHLWYLGWPDQGVPSEANSLIAFLIEARSQMKIQNGGNNSSPAVVHCSPGTGRTGTVIACDLCIREYEQTRMVDIPKCVFNLRRDRAGAVQTKDQYAFIYQVLNVYATKLTRGGIDSI